ncbi:MAG: class I mannose-6-phosphate isomerase [Bacteroidales bacterium]|nr:class I mannose-6-phosphate isomerase [Bacteroidales bacterium]
MYKPNYDKFPSIKLDGQIWTGWGSIRKVIEQKINDSGKQNITLAIECYHGVNLKELKQGFSILKPALLVDTKEVFLPEEKILHITYNDVTDDDIFGFMTRLSYSDILDKDKVSLARKDIGSTNGLVIVLGYAASLICQKPDILVYADMPRWEIQLRQRKHQINNIGINNFEEAPALQYKRSFFVDWRICDKQKKAVLPNIDFWLDTVKENSPKMITGNTMLKGLETTAKRPFRVMPFFDPGPWGGQWMKNICGLDKETNNYAWCFDCVPEENSLLFEIQGEIFELPSINLVFKEPTRLLGAPVESRFGREFPIRFDLLDTMQGGNLSLQVHPLTEYIRENFGIPYTQDESYYLLDAGTGASVFLGVKTGIQPQEMINDLIRAQNGDFLFDAEKYINKFPAKKHDHFLIPNGTIHCSGANSMVLEISATPYIFTFKLWDWNRLGLDGKPRPINIKHGVNVIQWNRNTEFCREELVCKIEKIGEGDGWVEERTGLHENEFIETRRHWFTKKVEHSTGNGVNVLNLIEGREAVVESPDNSFEPFIVHYAETFIVPASVGKYTIRPYGESEGKQCGTIKAYIRFKN